MGKMKEVTPDQYTQKLIEHKAETYMLTLQAWQVPILHGLIVLAADHPGVKKLHEPTATTIKHVRDWCRNRFAEWGFSPEEVEYLDKIREAKRRQR